MYEFLLALSESDIQFLAFQFLDLEIDSDEGIDRKYLAKCFHLNDCSLKLMRSFLYTEREFLVNDLL